MVIRDRASMIGGMTPVLHDGNHIFCTTDDAALATRCLPIALAMLREAEGVSFVLPMGDARRLGFDCTLPMVRIGLAVYSALDGVGLTAAVATVLADRSIPCNMIAGYHHDHVFVPADCAQEAFDTLQDLSRRERDDSLASA